MDCANSARELTCSMQLRRKSERCWKTTSCTNSARRRSLHKSTRCFSRRRHPTTASTDRHDRKNEANARCGRSLSKRAASLFVRVSETTFQSSRYSVGRRGGCGQGIVHRLRRRDRDCAGVAGLTAYEKIHHVPEGLDYFCTHRVKTISALCREGAPVAFRRVLCLRPILLFNQYRTEEPRPRVSCWGGWKGPRDKPEERRAVECSV